MDISFILNELGEERELYYNSVAPPIMQTSNFKAATVAELKELFADEYSGYLYSRGLNPTVEMLRKKLAALDGAEDALVFNNGAAASFAAVFAQVKSGDHIISVRKPYTWSQKMFDEIFPRFGVHTTYVDGTNNAEVEAAIRPETKVIYLESPNSWTYELQDLAFIAGIARPRGIVTIIDNTYCTPLWQRPLDFGIDIAMQTATKYISGHSDTLGGVLTGTHAMMRRIFESEYLNIGAGIQPFNAWLLVRGLRTLPLRLERSAASAFELIEKLEKHPAVSRIIYPFHPSFSQYELAKKQMKGCGGLLTFVVKAHTHEQVSMFCEALKRIMMAVSWGGHESLIMPKCASLEPADFDPANEAHRMLRLYVGLEEPDYLWADLEQAFEKVNWGG